MTSQEKVHQLMKLRQHWEQVCDNERHSQERNRKLLRELELVDARTSTLALQADKLRVLKDQYKSYISQIWPLWLEMQKTQRVPRSSTPKNTTRDHSLTTAELHLSSKKNSVKNTSFQNVQKSNSNLTDSLRMPYHSTIQPVSVGNRQRQQMTGRSVGRGRPVSSDEYLSKLEETLERTRIRVNSLQAAHNVHDKQLSLLDTSAVQNVKLPFNSKTSLPLLKRNSFAGFPSPNYSLARYFPTKAVNDMLEEHSWVRESEAGGMNKRPSTGIFDSHNLSKLEVERVEENAERDEVEGTALRYNNWMPNILPTPADKNFTSIQTDEHLPCHINDGTAELDNANTNSQLPLHTFHATHGTQDNPVQTGCEFVRDETYSHMHENTSKVTTVVLKDHTVVEQHDSNMAITTPPPFNNSHDDAAGNHKSEQQELAIYSKTMQLLSTNPTKSVFPNPNDEATNSQKDVKNIPKTYSDSVMSQKLDLSLVSNVRKASCDLELVKTESVQNGLGSSTHAVKEDEVTKIHEDVANDMMADTYDLVTRKTSMGISSSNIPKVEAAKLLDEAAAKLSSKHHAVPYIVSSQSDTSRDTDGGVENTTTEHESTVDNFISVEKISVDSMEVAENELRERVDTATSSSDTGRIIPADTVNIQSPKVQKITSLLDGSDSESDDDSFFDNEVKPNIIGSAAYLNLVQTTETRTQESDEDSDEIELAARVAPPADSEMASPSVPPSYEKPDEKSVQISSNNSPKSELVNNAIRNPKNPGWKMSTKEKFSALGMSVDSDSDVDIPQAVEAASDKDDFSF